MFVVTLFELRDTSTMLGADLAELGCGSTDMPNSVTTEVKERCPPDAKANAKCACYLTSARPKKWLI